MLTTNGMRFARAPKGSVCCGYGPYGGIEKEKRSNVLRHWHQGEPRRGTRT